MFGLRILQCLEERGRLQLLRVGLVREIDGFEKRERIKNCRLGVVRISIMDLPEWLRGSTDGRRESRAGIET